MGLRWSSMYWARRAFADLQLAQAADNVVASEPTYGVILHMCDRTYEHVAAAITCIATANAATAEVTARVAIEASTNIRFIMESDRN